MNSIGDIIKDSGVLDEERFMLLCSVMYCERKGMSHKDIAKVYEDESVAYMMPDTSICFIWDKSDDGGVQIHFNESVSKYFVGEWSMTFAAANELTGKYQLLVGEEFFVDEDGHMCYRDGNEIDATDDTSEIGNFDSTIIPKGATIH